MLQPCARCARCPRLVLFQSIIQSGFFFDFSNEIERNEYRFSFFFKVFQEVDALWWRGNHVKRKAAKIKTGHRIHNNLRLRQSHSDAVRSSDEWRIHEPRSQISDNKFMTTRSCGAFWLARILSKKPHTHARSAIGNPGRFDVFKPIDCCPSFQLLSFSSSLQCGGIHTNSIYLSKPRCSLVVHIN